MEVACNIACLRSVKNIPRISVWNTAKLALLTYREQEELRYIVDNMGKLSAQAQHLRTPITDYNRLKAGSHTLYLYTTGMQGKTEFILAKGMLKVGKKNLFIRKDNGHLVEMAPLCVLDFYVHESCQRIGLGHELFEAMLTREKKSPRELGFDRPSSKFHSFLSKYYQLNEFMPQANQYVVFNDYFDEQAYDNKDGYTLDDRGKESSRPHYLENSYKKDKVLHGRRANHSETSTVDGDVLPVGKLEPDVEESNDISIADPCTSQQQPCGRRKSRHHMANVPVVNKVSCSSNINQTQKQSSGNFVVEQYQSNMHGRRNTLPLPNRCADARKQNEKFYVRHPSPLSLPKPLQEEPKEESCYNPYKFLRTENTRSRLFHEDSFFEKDIRPKPKFKCPFWTDEAHAFDTKSFDSVSKMNYLTPGIPVSFEKTRICYHAGMKGCGAAEAMGYHNGLIR